MGSIGSEAPRGGTRVAGDEGSVIVESALVFPVLFFILFGIIEVGLLFASYLTVGNAANAGGRAVAIYGNDLNADFELLEKVDEESAALAGSNIDRIVVYKASGPTDSIDNHPACKSGLGQNSGGHASPAVGSCNVYTALDLADSDVDNFDCNDDPAPNKAKNYCPSKRKTAVQGTNGPPDYVGIYLEYEHEFFTGLFGESRELTAEVIVKLEPQSLN